MMDDDRRADYSERNRMALDATRHDGGSRAHDASADASSPVTTPDPWAKFPKCRDCMQRWTCAAVAICWTTVNGKRVLQDQNGAPVVNG